MTTPLSPIFVSYEFSRRVASIETKIGAGVVAWPSR
jgi:hypothetical protein